MEGCGWHLGQGCHQFLFSLPTGRKATPQGSLISRSNSFFVLFFVAGAPGGVRPKSPAAEPKRGMAPPSRASNAPKKQFKWIPGMESVLFGFRFTGLEGVRPKSPGQSAKRVGCKNTPGKQSPQVELKGPTLRLGVCSGPNRRMRVEKIKPCAMLGFFLPALREFFPASASAFLILGQLCLHGFQSKSGI